MLFVFNCSWIAGGRINLGPFYAQFMSVVCSLYGVFGKYTELYNKANIMECRGDRPILSEFRILAWLEH